MPAQSFWFRRASVVTALVVLLTSCVDDTLTAPDALSPQVARSSAPTAEMVSVTDITVARLEGTRPYKVVYGGPEFGARAYIDRTYTYERLRPGSVYIQTANGDQASSGDDFLSFRIDRDAIVSVALFGGTWGNTLPDPPAWMDEFNRAWYPIKIVRPSGAAYDHWLFERRFPAGTVTLGGNRKDPGSDEPMYTVFIRPAPSPRSPYTPVKVPDLEIIRAISPTGTLAGAYSGRAAIWKDGMRTELGTLPGDGGSIALGINASGSVVGESIGVGRRRAFLWKAGVMMDLGTLGGPAAGARGINASGAVVGWSTNGDGHTRPFLWEEGEMTDLGSLGGAAGAAYAIANDGTVVGYSRTPRAARRAVIWKGGVMSRLDDGGLSSSAAHTIGPEGTIGGECGHLACIWREGRMTLIPVGKVARGIAADGTVVGDTGDLSRIADGFTWKDGGPGIQLEHAGGALPGQGRSARTA